MKYSGSHRSDILTDERESTRLAVKYDTTTATTTTALTTTTVTTSTTVTSTTTTTETAATTATTTRMNFQTVFLSPYEK